MTKHVKVLKISAESDWKNAVVTMDGDLASLQQAVGGDLEGLFGPGWSAYLDDEGKMKRLPVNTAADRLARELGWKSMPGDMLCGNVLFLGPCDEEGNDTNVPASVLAAAKKLGIL